MATKKPKRPKKQIRLPMREPFPAGSLVTKATSAPCALTFNAKAAPTVAPGVYRFTASTGEPDRVGDRIIPSSWKVDAYKRNPVVLRQHRHDELPIGRARNVWVDATGLQADIEFLPEGMNPDADRVRALVASGYLSAVSVGFKPGPTAKNTYGGVDYLFPCELLEISVVTIPANPSAMLHGRAQRAEIEKWVKGAASRTVVFRLKDEPFITLRDEPEPRYAINENTARAFLTVLRDTLTGTDF